MIDSTTCKAHRCSAGGKGGAEARPSAAAEADARPKFMPLPTLGRLIAFDLTPGQRGDIRPAALLQPFTGYAT